MVIQTLRWWGRGDTLGKKFFWPFGPQFGLKIKAWAPSLNPPLTCIIISNTVGTMVRIDIGVMRHHTIKMLVVTEFLSSNLIQ